MEKRMKSIASRFFTDESGQALILVLALLVLGSLTIAPVLSHVGTALKTGEVYKVKTEKFYAADAGIEDAIWQIKYDGLEPLFGDPNYTYDFSANASYELDDPVNGLTTNVTIKNVWIPSNVSPPSDPATAKAIIESNKLMVSGTAGADPGDNTYKIMVYFTPDAGEEDDLLVDSLGLWLPYGFSFVSGSSTLEQLDPWDDAYAVPVVSNHAGGQAIVWSFSSANLTYFPGVDILDVPQHAEVTIEYTANVTGAKPVGISWIETSGAVSDILPVTWDVDTRIYKITSVAADTEIEAYASRNELRDIDSAIAGDYKAIGNSLMRDNPGWPYYIRDELLSESTTSVNDIPSNAEVITAYLYWSGWYDDIPTNDLWTDSCDNFTNWSQSGTDWQISSGAFRAQHAGGAPSGDRYLTMTTDFDLDSYQAGTIAVSWEQWENGSLGSSDALQFQFSGDDGSSWSSLITAFSNDIGSNPVEFSEIVPEEYMTDEFKIRFYISGFTDSGNYAFIDNFAIGELLPDTDVVFKINGDQVYLDENNDPQMGTGNVTATDWQVLENQPGQHSYACKRDVTNLVKAYSDLGEGTNRTGNGDYTVGGVDADTGEHWSYAGWSLIIIYFSPESAGHQLYLYEDFAWAQQYTNLDFDGDGQPGGTISDFIVPEPIEGETDAAKLTAFVAEGDDWIGGDQLIFNGTALSDGFGTGDVWNSKSVGMSEDGMDIDTFTITWASGLLEPGDTTAQLDLPTDSDNWNLIYLILSLRSETHTGGTTHYFIRSN